MVKTVKTLFVSPQLPWPLDAGSKLRIYNLLRAYAELGPVTLVCFAQDEAELQHAPEMERYCHRVVCVPFDSGPSADVLPAGKLRTLLSQVIQLRPRMIRSFTSEAVTGHINALLEAEDFDIVHFARLSMTGNAAGLVANRFAGRRPFRVVDTDDHESEKVRRHAAVEPWSSRRKYLHLLEYAKLHVYERRTLSRFDCALVCSENDPRLRHPRVPSMEIVGNGAVVESASADPTPKDDGRTLMFLGAMGYPPNQDAVVWFVTHVLPLVRPRVPEVRFVIAGQKPSAAVSALHNGRDVLVTGYVHDTAELFRSSTVSVVPIRIAGGTRIKILESMAAAVPVISTTIGCEGIDAVPGEHVVIADTAQEFADRCVTLLLDPARRAALGRAGRSLVERQYRWEDIRDRYVRVLQRRFERALPSRAGEPLTPSLRAHG
jgi:glycosyltransferase involved in cell wall biosynthesis